MRYVDPLRHSVKLAILLNDVKPFIALFNLCLIKPETLEDD